MARARLRFELIFRPLARLSLRKRRIALRVVYRVAACIGRPWTSGLSSTFQKYLRLSGRRADRLDREAAFFDWLAELEWLALLRRSRAGLLRDLDAVAFDRPETIRKVAATGRPVVLAPLHMGAYTPCLAALMFRFFPDRPFLILRRRDDMPMETRVLERIRDFGIDMRFLNVTERADYLAAMRFARKGAVIVVFCDLPPDYGNPAPMPLFGQPFSFAFGLDGMARLLDAVVLPIRTVATLRGDTVAVGQPFEVAEGGAVARGRAAGRIGRHIAAALEEMPEQWHLWASVAEYLPAPATLPVPPPAEEPVAVFANAAE